LPSIEELVFLSGDDADEKEAPEPNDASIVSYVAGLA